MDRTSVSGTEDLGSNPGGSTKILFCIKSLSVSISHGEWSFLTSGLKGFRRKVYIGVMSKLEVGNPAPKFKLEDQKGEIVRLSDFIGRKVLVFFYPKADTPGCTVQSCSVSEFLGELTELAAVPIGISPDSPEDQLKFDEKFSLGFPLLADRNHAVAEAYGVWGEKSMYGKSYLGIIRSSFIIDEKGTVFSVWYGWHKCLVVFVCKVRGQSGNPIP